MKRKKLLAKFIDLFYAGNIKQKDLEIIKLEEYLKDNTELLIEQNNTLKRELTWLYETLLHHSNCRFQLEYDDEERFLIVTTGCSARKIDIIVYLTSERQEIAAVSARPSDNTLLIEDIKMDFAECDICVGKIILQELITQARASGLLLINGILQKQPEFNFYEQVQFYRLSGFEVTAITANTEDESGVLQYSLEDNLS